MPGDEVLTGVMQYIGNRPIPTWVMTPHAGDNNSQERVFILIPHGRNLIVNLEPFHNHHNQNFQDYRCFITSRMHIIFATHLRRCNYPILFPPLIVYPLIFVRIPDHNNTIYGGQLHLEDGHVPEWLSRELRV